MDDPERMAWHTEQFGQPTRSTIHLADFALDTLGGPVSGEALDVACGAGANIVHLRERLGGSWTGLDLDEDLVAFGSSRGLNLVAGDLFRLDERFDRDKFDVCFSLMTLSWLSDYEEAMEQMLAVTNGWVFVSSLFAETDFDAFVKVRNRGTGQTEAESLNYNVYSLSRFEAFCRGIGATEVIAKPFEIDVDLPRSDGKGMGSWTERTADGRRITFSGPVWMPWWFLAVR